MYATEYELNVEEQPPAKNEIRPPKVEHADVGSTVVLRCNSQKYPARFQWTRQHGHFASGQITTNVIFLILLFFFYFEFIKIIIINK